MLVTDAVAAVLADFGADTVFGVVGSGNFHVTNALINRGARFVAARHECGAASMADGWARTTGRPGVLSVHQGPGLTNALTGITEAAKSRTPLVVLAADAPVRGIGVETVGTDAGAAHSFDPPFPCHSSLLGAGKYGLTQLRNLARLPAQGSVVIAGPLPLVGGSGSPCRALALVEHS